MLLATIQTIGYITVSLMIAPAVVVFAKIVRESWLRAQYVRGDQRQS